MQPARLTRRTWMAGAVVSALPAAPPETVRLPRKIRVALLGLEGHTSEILGPLPQLPDVELAAISHSDSGELARFGKNSRIASAKRYTDYREMLDREHLDMVAVCNNDGERAAAILECLGRKLPVIAEKPLAIHREDLERIRKAVPASGVRLSMLLPMRFSPPYLALKQIAHSGEIGEVAQISAQKSYKAGDRPAWQRNHSTYGGTIPWIGIHMVDLMRWSSGREFTEAVSLQSHIGFPQLGDMENTTGSLFRLDNGGVATLHMDYLRPETAPTHGDDRLRLAGTSGVVEYMAATGVTVISSSRKPETLERLPPEQSVFVDFLESVYLGKKPELSLDDVYRVTEIVLVAQQAAEQHRILSI